MPRIQNALFAVSRTTILTRGSLDQPTAAREQMRVGKCSLNSQTLCLTMVDTFRIPAALLWCFLAHLCTWWQSAGSSHANRAVSSRCSSQVERGSSTLRCFRTGVVGEGQERAALLAHPSTHNCPPTHLASVDPRNSSSSHRTGRDSQEKDTRLESTP